jgi:hypothetical protein
MLMETQFYLLLSLKTPQGFVHYGQYFLGNDRFAAMDLFEQMDGSRVPPDGTLLHIDLMETVEELPVTIRTIGCTLDELCANSKLIAREMFRLTNLKEID